MGHEHIGKLPKSQCWREVVSQIAALQGGAAGVDDLARRVLHNVRSRLRQVERDSGVKAGFRFLLALAVSAGMPNPRENLLQQGIPVPDNPTVLSLAQAVHDYVDSSCGSPEYAQIARSAAGDAIAAFHKANKSNMQNLFEPLEDPFSVWRRAATGGGFCDLARSFFAKLTERYLNYFLDREASAALSSVERSGQLRMNLREHVDGVSRHAFETARITQSFAAGWFNKNAVHGLPDDRAIEGFLRHAFGKMREELLQEESEP